jgi:hypothetical protein
MSKIIIKSLNIQNLSVDTINLNLSGSEGSGAFDPLAEMCRRSAKSPSSERIAELEALLRVKELERALSLSKGPKEGETVPAEGQVSVSITHDEPSAECTKDETPAEGQVSVAITHDEPSAEFTKDETPAEASAVITPVEKLPQDGILGDKDTPVVDASFTPVKDDDGAEDDEYDDEDDEHEYEDEDEDEDDFEEDDDDEDSEGPTTDVDGEDTEEAEQDGDDEGHDLPSATITPVSRGSADITLERTSGVTVDIQPEGGESSFDGTLSDDAEIRPGNMTQEDIDSINAEFDRVADTEAAERADEEAAAVASAAESTALGVESETLNETDEGGTESETSSESTSDVSASFQRI